MEAERRTPTPRTCRITIDQEPRKSSGVSEAPAPPLDPFAHPKPLANNNSTIIPPFGPGAHPHFRHQRLQRYHRRGRCKGRQQSLIQRQPITPIFPLPPPPLCFRMSCPLPTWCLRPLRRLHVSLPLTFKSKREFKDDLDLVWSNCLMYSAAPVRHPSYARCVYRLWPWDSNLELDDGGRVKYREPVEGTCLRRPGCIFGPRVGG